MNWTNLGDFAAMGGYGSYVWGSFGMVAALLVIEVLTLRRRWRQARLLVQKATASRGEER